MQFNTQISGSIISVVQGLVLLFVSADVIIRWLYRLKVRSERGTLTLSPAAAAAVAAAGQVETLARDYVSPLGVDLTAGYRTMGPAGEEIESSGSIQVEEEADDSG
jgi:O-antigen ligase